MYSQVLFHFNIHLSLLDGEPQLVSDVTSGSHSNQSFKNLIQVTTSAPKGKGWTRGKHKSSHTVEYGMFYKCS